MPPKSPRGIQPEDVVQAADALIAEGLRPTIERVRQKIGRGSPNTVSPLLDAWFATLGQRLGLAEIGNTQNAQKKSTTPAPVQQAAYQLWESALLVAHEEAQKTLQLAHETIATERAELTQKENDFEYQKQVLIARQIANDEALQNINHQLSEKIIKLEEAEKRENQQARAIDILHEKLNHAEVERAAIIQRNGEEIQLHIEERTRLENRAMANERRLLEELDRERQETKRINVLLNELKTNHLSVVLELNTSTNEIKSTKQELISANSRVNELNNLLENQRVEHQTTLTKLTTLKKLDLILSNASRQKKEFKKEVKK